MTTRLLLIFTYILSCFRVGTAPWRYFQLNARYFSNQKGIFSKIDIDTLIPKAWRLDQIFDDGKTIPDRFPVFVKPEWGQNAQGIYRADNAKELAEIRLKTVDSDAAYIIQEAAKGIREFEVFSILMPENNNNYAIITITETLNKASGRFPINGVKNRNSIFHEITAQFNQQQLAKVWSHLRQLGEFKISRVCVRADSTQNLIDGQFQVIEINLYVPMPINLLDKKYTLQYKIKFIRKSMLALANATKTLAKTSRRPAIFIKKLLYQRKIKTRFESRETI